MTRSPSGAENWKLKLEFCSIIALYHPYQTAIWFLDQSARWHLSLLTTVRHTLFNQNRSFHLLINKRSYIFTMWLCLSTDSSNCVCFIFSFLKNYHINQIFCFHRLINKSSYTFTMWFFCTTDSSNCVCFIFSFLKNYHINQIFRFRTSFAYMYSTQTLITFTRSVLTSATNVRSWTKVL